MSFNILLVVDSMLFKTMTFKSDHRKNNIDIVFPYCYKIIYVTRLPKEEDTTLPRFQL